LENLALGALENDPDLTDAVIICVEASLVAWQPEVIH